MKIWGLILFLVIPFAGYGQQPVPEPALHESLLYASDDIQHLKKIADSLNLRYLQCEANPIYYSVPQTFATLIKLRVKEDQAAALGARLKDGIGLQQILTEFRGTNIRDSTSVILARQIRYNGYTKKYDTLLYSGDSHGFALTGLSAPFDVHALLYSKSEDAKDWEEGYSTLKIWRLHGAFTSIKLPLEYAKMIQYVDCITDTSMILMQRRELSGEKNKYFDPLWLYVLRNRTSKKAKRYANHFDEDDLKYIHGGFYTNDSLHLLLNNAVVEAVEKGNSNEILEGAATGIYSPDTVLLMKRSRIVNASCGLDDAPLRHARDIAILASQTRQWPVFIRAHLDIMNDYFIRMSDSRYARSNRKTYIRELEVLDIPVQQLLLGAIFNADNLAWSHYFGNLNRTGRAFTESAYTASFEKQIKAIMKDEELDPFNKSLFFILYTSYCYHYPEKRSVRAKIRALRRASASYPAYIRTGISDLSVKNRSAY